MLRSTQPVAKLRPSCEHATQQRRQRMRCHHGTAFGCQVPMPQRAIGARRNQRLAVGQVGQRLDGRRVARQLPRRLASWKSPETDYFVAAQRWRTGRRAAKSRRTTPNWNARRNGQLRGRRPGPTNGSFRRHRPWPACCPSGATTTKFSSLGYWPSIVATGFPDTFHDRSVPSRPVETNCRPPATI